MTVHGTNATGPVVGENWWQIGGEFEQTVRHCVEASNGELKFVPVVWDGSNSERARRRAGHKLLQTMLQLEQAGEHYCVVGHSHGGSAIALGLMEAVGSGRSLSRLTRWITVGTPFIHLKKQRFLFSRIGLLGKCSFVAVLTFALFFILSFFLNGMKAGFSLWGFGIMLLPFLIMYSLLRFFNHRKLYLYKTSNKANFEKKHKTTWVQLNHPDDEAVEGLSALSSIDLPVFNNKFAVSALTFLGALLLPLFLLFFVTSPALMTRLEVWVGRKSRFGELDNVLANIEFIADVIKGYAINGAIYISEKMDFFISGIGNETTRFSIELVLSLISLVALPVLAILAIAYLILGAVALISNGVSLVLSKGLNVITWRQIRASAFGNDTVGETAVNSGTAPFWMTGNRSILPNSLADELSNYSDAEAAETIPKLRAAVRTLAFSEEGKTKSDVLADYLTWNELIHTSYFKVPRFRKLVACVVANSDGFQETEAFRNDSNYDAIKFLYSEINQGSALIGK